jgi:lysyl-tRNA synthetase class 2
MATLKDFRDERLKKLEKLLVLGVDPYPATARRTIGAGQVAPNFDQLVGSSQTVAGRIISLRKFGKLAFIVVKDITGKLQLFLRTGDVAERGDQSEKSAAKPKPDNLLGLKDLNLLDSGDFIEASGQIIKTKTGEISLGVSQLRLLAKALRPLPTEQDGFTDKEERLRRRYVDINVNDDVRQRFIRRSRFWQATRQFLLDQDFLEINVPVLESVAGGADANPFVTHMNALDQDFYLRISHELPLKRLLVAGYEKVFDIGPRFRNENYSDEHLPEHIAMEWYWAYADWQDGMDLTEAMIRFIVDKTWGGRQFQLANGQTVDFGTDGQHWPRLSFPEILSQQFKIDVFESSIQEIQAKLAANNLEVAKSDNRQRALDKLWKSYRKQLAGPVFLIDMPTFMQPLAKKKIDDGRLTQQFNLVFGGSEMCKAFSELNDPLDQLKRFQQQQQLRDAGDDEAQMMDIDFVEALEYGMPPACGLGFSERVFWSLDGVTAREGVPFPAMRREISELTRSTYPNVRLD